MNPSQLGPLPSSPRTGHLCVTQRPSQHLSPCLTLPWGLALIILQIRVHMPLSPGGPRAMRPGRSHPPSCAHTALGAALVLPSPPPSSASSASRGLGAREGRALSAQHPRHAWCPTTVEPRSAPGGTLAQDQPHPQRPEPWFTERSHPSISCVGMRGSGHPGQGLGGQRGATRFSGVHRAAGNPWGQCHQKAQVGSS